MIACHKKVTVTFARQRLEAAAEREVLLQNPRGGALVDVRNRRRKDQERVVHAGDVTAKQPPPGRPSPQRTGLDEAYVLRER